MTQHCPSIPTGLAASPGTILLLYHSSMKVNKIKALWTAGLTCGARPALVPLQGFFSIRQVKRVLGTGMFGALQLYTVFLSYTFKNTLGVYGNNAF